MEIQIETAIIFGILVLSTIPIIIIMQYKRILALKFLNKNYHKELEEADSTIISLNYKLEHIKFRAEKVIFIKNNPSDFHIGFETSLFIITDKSVFGLDKKTKEEMKQSSMLKSICFFGEIIDCAIRNKKPSEALLNYSKHINSSIQWNYVIFDKITLKERSVNKFELENLIKV